MRWRPLWLFGDYPLSGVFDRLSTYRLRIYRILFALRSFLTQALLVDYDHESFSLLISYSGLTPYIYAFLRSLRVFASIPRPILLQHTVSFEDHLGSPRRLDFDLVRYFDVSYNSQALVP